MSVIERTTNVQRPERAVFVTDDDRRARRLRRGAFAVTALACLWLVGLGVGMLGFGSLPGVSLITPGHEGKQRAAPAHQQARDVARLSPSLDHRRLVARRAQARRTARASALQQRAAATRAVPRSRAVTRPAAPRAAVAPPAQQPVNPAQRQRGWARKGQPAPRGQLRTDPPPPATAQGQRRGQQTTTTTPLPPGQAKKTPPPG